MSVAVDRQMDLMLAELVQGSIQMLMSVAVEHRKETVLSRTSKLVEPVQNLWQLERGRSQKHQMDLVLAVLFEKAVVVFENVVVVAGQGLHQMDSMLAVFEKAVVVDSLLLLQTDPFKSLHWDEQGVQWTRCRVRLIMNFYPLLLSGPRGRASWVACQLWLW